MTLHWSTINSFQGNSSSRSLATLRACPICGSLHSKTVIGFDDFQFFSDDAVLPKRLDLKQVQCLDCFAAYMNPCYCPFGFSVLFAEASQSYGSTAERPAEQLGYLAARGLLDEGMRVLDVGCHDGRFLATLPDKVSRVGIDIDPASIKLGRQQHHTKAIEFICGDFERFDYRSASPTVITVFHVLEHLPRPVAVLKKLRSISAEVTRLVVEVPILEKGDTNDINGFLTAQHVTHFSRQSFRNALGLAGWRVVEWMEMEGYNGCRVLANPTGEPWTPRAEPADIPRLYQHLASWYRAIERVDERLAPLRDARQCVVWGAGLHTEYLYHTTSLFHARQDRRYILVDSDPTKQGRSWRGVPIYSPNILTGIDWARTALVISSYASQESMAGTALEHGIPAASIVRLYNDVRVY